MLLSDKHILKAIQEMPGWEFHDSFITKAFKLENFKTALAFVNQIGELAEEKDHHPDILLHSWNQVTITLSTHSEGGVTEKDMELAKGINDLNE